MASDVNICNLALSNIGEEANVQSLSPPDNSVAAEKCAQFYPIARDLLLEMHAWTFNTRRATLATVANPTNSWMFAYSLPSDCIKPLAVFLPESTDDTYSQDFVVEAASDGTAILYTNVQYAVLKYQVQTVDTGRFTPGFVAALSWLLATFLAGAILKGKAALSVAAGARQMFAITFAQATGSNANASQLRDAMANRVPAHLLARR